MDNIELLEKKKELRKLLNESDNIVFFGGAGVSTASGIPDFRSANGLYNQRASRMVAPEEILSHSFFTRYPEEFFEFYREKMIYLDAKPNGAHEALASLEAVGKLKAVVTQNIDGLHQKAGTKKVLELHGSIHKNRCMKCGKLYELTKVLEKTGIPFCETCGGIIKPEVVLYEESLDDAVIEESIRYLKQADMLIIGGTSLSVYPAAGLISYYNGKKLVLINKTETLYDQRADLVLYGDIAEILKDVTEKIKE